MKKNFNDVDLLFDELFEQALFTYEELNLITNINGYSIETLNDAIFARYGYRDLQQLMEEL